MKNTGLITQTQGRNRFGPWSIFCDITLATVVDPDAVDGDLEQRETVMPFGLDP